ncbi:helix-turn-helix domain-containing protein [Pelosinus sp. sgz500959]|uniref:helix-turn-helix domain-containing protein n=1 Tax=Pelosinus sp. sgz500959 TaxID=3242472 RepID=UPI00366F991B
MERIFESEDKLKAFISENVITTMEAAEILGCSRRNIDKLVQKGKLIPVKQTLRDKLFLKNDILDRIEK